MSKIKSWAIGGSAIVVILLAILGWYGAAQRAAYLKASGAATLYAEKYKASLEKANTEIAALLASTAAAETQKQAALAAAAAERALRVKADAERDGIIAKTKALPDDTLSSAINLRIGEDESKPIASGVFSFTRPGAENTLNLFISGETAATDRDSAIREAAHNADSLALCETQRGNLAAEIKTTADERDLAKLGWDKEAEALSHLEKSIFGRTVKVAVISAGVGAGLVLILHLCGVIK